MRIFFSTPFPNDKIFITLFGFGKKLPSNGFEII